MVSEPFAFVLSHQTPYPYTLAMMTRSEAVRGSTHGALADDV